METIQKNRLLTLKTSNGCRIILAICIIFILLCGFFAHLISTDGGQVKITRLTIDTRGASVDADLYYPVGTDSTDKLPAVVIAHGGGVAKGVTQGIAEEFARRGYVVLNPSAFGAGMSEQPNVDDSGLNPDSFSVFSSAGVLDAVNYLRTLEIVDKTRIGIVGHSLGALRAMVAATADCGYFTYNDIMINKLHDTFGQEFTEAEILKNAAQLAEERLNKDQLAHYKTLEKICWEEYNTRIKSICLLGTDGGLVISLKPVTVAGHDVLRNLQTNFGIILGKWDHNVPAFDNRDRSQEYWHTTDEVEAEKWYVLDTANHTGSIVGSLFETSSTENPDLKAGIDSRSVRVFNFINETHSKNFFSVQAAKYAVKYIEQTLGYNRGDLSAQGTVALDYKNIIYLWREMLTLVAMLAMIAMLAPIAGLLVKTKFFASCVPEKRVMGGSTNKRQYWIFCAVAVILTFFAMYATNKLDPPSLPSFRFLPLFPSWWLTVLYLAILAIGSVIFLITYAASDKKVLGQSKLAVLNFKMRPVNILKTVLASVIMIAVAYFSLVLLEYLFDLDYRCWMASFSEVRAEYWGWTWRYAILMFPSFLAIGASINYSVRADIPQWKDTAITVIVNSLGVWLLCLINYISLASSDVMISSFISSYGFLLIVPVTVYITRKMYLLTNSIWLGASVNALLLSWSLISACGLHPNVFYGQTWISNFLGR